MTPDTGTPSPRRRVVTGVVVASLTAVLIVGLAAVAVGRVEHSAVDDHRFASTDAVRLAGGDADVTVTTAAVEAIEVRRDARWSGRDITQPPRLRGDVIELQGCRPPWWRLVVTPGRLCQVRYDVRVPAGTAVAVEMDTGDLRLSGDLGEVAVDSDTGGVDARDLRTRFLRADLDTGSLRIGSGIARLDAELDTGDLRGDAVSTSVMHVSVDTGSVDARFVMMPSLVDIDTDTGSVRLGLPDGGYAIQATADTGDVDVEPRLVNGRSPRSVVVSTDTGDIDLEVAP